MAIRKEKSVSVQFVEQIAIFAIFGSLFSRGIRWMVLAFLVMMAGWWFYFQNGLETVTDPSAYSIEHQYVTMLPGDGNIAYHVDMAIKNLEPLTMDSVHLHGTLYDCPQEELEKLHGPDLGHCSAIDQGDTDVDVDAAFERLGHA